MEMDPETSLRLFEEGGILVFLDVPIGTEVGIDMETWNTGEKFKGIKMIPPGIHFVHFSTVGKDGRSQSPRIGFFHSFKKGEVLCKKYDPRTEDLSIEVVPETELNCFKDNLKELDQYLGPYPYQSWRKWVSLSNRITESTSARLSPTNGRICSAPELKLDSDQSIPEPHKKMTKLEHAESLLPRMSETESSKIRYTIIPVRLYELHAPAPDITKHNMDWSLKLEVFMELCGGPNELLAELQFSFICFLVGQNYNSFEQWKSLIKLLCYSYTAIPKYQVMYTDLISDLYFQMTQVGTELFTDIVTQNNLIYNCCKKLFDSILRDFDDDGPTQLGSGLVSKAQRFQDFLTSKFGWIFDEEDDEERPVIVDLAEEGN